MSKALLVVGGLSCHWRIANKYATDSNGRLLGKHSMAKVLGGNVRSVTTNAVIDYIGQYRQTAQVTLVFCWLNFCRLSWRDAAWGTHYDLQIWLANLQNLK